MDSNRGRLHYLAKQARHLIDTDPALDWLGWALNTIKDLTYIHWSEQRQADYNIMLELTRLKGTPPAAKLIALELMKGNKQ